MAESPHSAPQRAQAYWLLSELLLNAPKAERLLELAAALSSFGVGGNGAFHLHDNILLIPEPGKELDELELRLGREFVLLFRGIRENEGSPPPYESLIVQSPDPLAIVADVTDFARRAGFTSVPGLDDQADHLGGELRLMALLATAEAESVVSGHVNDTSHYRQLQLEFLITHMANWVPYWCKMARDAATETFYIAVIDSISALLKSDRQYLVWLNKSS